jgi:hypothetical protein
MGRQLAVEIDDLRARDLAHLRAREKLSTEITIYPQDL